MATKLKTISSIKTKIPSKYAVLLLNDDYTSMEFVVEVLQRFFNKSTDDAQTLMLKIHIEGEAICGIFSFDIAQTKVTQVTEFSRKNNQPLMSVIKELNEV